MVLAVCCAPGGALGFSNREAVCVMANGLQLDRQGRAACWCGSCHGVCSCAGFGHWSRYRENRSETIAVGPAAAIALGAAAPCGKQERCRDCFTVVVAPLPVSWWCFHYTPSPFPLELCKEAETPPSLFCFMSSLQQRLLHLSEQLPG